MIFSDVSWFHNMTSYVWHHWTIGNKHSFTNHVESSTFSTIKMITNHRLLRNPETFHIPFQSYLTFFQPLVRMYQLYYSIHYSGKILDILSYSPQKFSKFVVSLVFTWLELYFLLHIVVHILDGWLLCNICKFYVNPLYVLYSEECWIMYYNSLA